VPRLFDVIHLYGTDRLNTQEIYEYFEGNDVRYVGWLTDSTCNVFFRSHKEAIKALRSLAVEEKGEERLGDHLNKSSSVHLESQFPTRWFKVPPF